MEELFKDKKFLEDISKSIKNIIHKNFPDATGGEKEDIEQDVKLKIWKMVSDGKKIRNLRSYLWKVVYTTTLDILEKRMEGLNRGELIKFHKAGQNHHIEKVLAESAVEDKETREILEKVLASLPEKRRTVIKLHFSGLTIEDMAEFLGWSKPKVRHLLYRGLNDMKKKLNEYEKQARFGK